MNRAPDTPDRVSKPRARPVLVSESMHANRSRRGEPVGDYHDQTLIPPSDPTIKPMPPRTSDHTKFTDEDRIFFIHYLRWRLYDGEVPTKNELYEELATEVSAPVMVVICACRLTTLVRIVATSQRRCMEKALAEPL